MAQEMRDATRQGTERVKQLAETGVFGMRDFAEHNVEQAREAFEGMLSATQRTMATLDMQAAEMHQTTLGLTSRAIANSFEFSHRLLRARSAEEIVRLQAEFAESQMQALADQAREFGSAIAEQAREVGEKSRQFGEETARQAGDVMRTAASNLPGGSGNPAPKETAPGARTK